jgi:prepilin-type N-terminal cleavage/methylation domain-containing protein
MFHNPTHRSNAPAWQEIACPKVPSNAPWAIAGFDRHPAGTMNKTPSNSENSAFTLIELLIVIAIIGILMSLLFPAVNSAIDAAKKAQAKNDVAQIATAVVAYETEYGKLPDTNEFPKIVTGDWLKALGGSNVGTPPLNPRQIVFLELAGAKRGKSGTNSSGTFVDPWGGNYMIWFDGNYDNDVKGGTNSVSIRKKVAVWNDPSTQSNSTSAQKPRRYVTSWE